jgi:hypothetical protein
MTEVRFACVAENQPRFYRQARYLVHSIRTFGGGLRDSPVFVAFVDDVEPEYRRSLTKLGADVLVVDRVNVGPPPANKLRMLELPLGSADVLVALDCDTVIASDFEHLLTGEVRAKPSDTNGHRAEFWARLYRAVDLDVPSDWFPPTEGGPPKPPQYNSGVIVFPRDVVPFFRERWMDEIVRLSRAVKRNPFLMRRSFKFFNEQIAFAFTVHRHGLPFETLPVGGNFPTHARVASDLVAETERPTVLHYHRAVDEAGFLGRPVEGAIAGVADEVNRSIAAAFGVAYDELRDPVPLEPVPPLRRRIARRLGAKVRMVPGRAG